MTAFKEKHISHRPLLPAASNTNPDTSPIQQDISNDESDTSSSEDLLAEELDQIGLLNLNYFASYLSRENFTLPNIPNSFSLPNMPNGFSLPNMPNMPNGFSLPNIPNAFSLPNMPSLELSKIQDFSKEFSNYVSNYSNYYIKRDKATERDDEVRIVDSIKTVLSTRIQMNKFLHDLNLGVNITTAIDRLQPLTDIIHQTIFLPAEDESEYEDDYHKDENYEDENEEITEPGGVGGIVNKSQPLINEIVKPDIPIMRTRRYRRWRNIGDSEVDSTASQTSDIDGLTVDEVKDLTELNCVSDFLDKEEVLRKRIQRIQNLDGIDQNDKNKLVTKLMMGNYYKYINEKLSQENKPLLSPLKKQKLVINDPPATLENLAEEDDQMSDSEMVEEEDEVETEAQEEDEDEVILTEQDQIPSYHDAPFNTVLGCSHYQRNCKIECPTCLKWYPCRFCHDAQITDHKLIRNEVKHILCMHCNTPQVPDTNYCVNCEQELANYFCLKCVLYDNDPTKEIYHCDKCGICRLGLGLEKDYFHCDTCNICLSIDLRDKHKCVTNTTHCNCMICNEYLFTSVQKVVFMKCGHSIHQHCYDELIKHSYKCPICKKTIVNVETQFRLLDQEVNQNPLPPPYNSWRCIISCNDCKGKSNAPYHVLGLKCKYCKSYNTNQLKLIKPEEEDDEDSENKQEEEEHNFDANVMKLVKTNLSNNFGIDEQMTGENSGYEDEDYEAEEEEEDEEQAGNLVPLKKLTNSILNDRGGVSNASYITTMFQNFINNATKTNDKSDDH
ncbi:uncharacterized protein J8A68_001312 [[Candida] subhashii]|uniref:Uncharacterized protein n=1 Tax=[Candida] subhashii TaxID=561895 RepID=A0A8J5QIH2_9ASCO|nr:uncharacterized protein J8A68_001312 [[Candida] subhashii]KAG7665256.1 hypothetical protein J8A68_001312 [[Candida] subhashii]